MVRTLLHNTTKIILNQNSLAIDGIQTTTGNMPYVNASLSQHINVSDFSKMPKLAEWHIYGNEQQGRFAVKKPDKDPVTDPLYYLDALTTDVTNKNFFRILDKKEYELKDHLGNVRVAIGDMKIPTGTRGIAPFVVDEKSVSDFYPGGMAISDRSWQSTNYRYGYNGQEKSLEIDANGNHHTAEFWEVNNASLRRWNRDPKPTVGISEYSLFGGNPVRFSDPNGDSAEVVNTKKSDLLTNGIVGESVSSNQFSTTHLQRQLNNCVTDWNNPINRHYAPKVAEYLIENLVEVELFKQNESVTNGYADKVIGLNESLYKGAKVDKNGSISYLEKTFFHEIIHKMDDANGEFQARTGTFAAGFTSKSEIISQFTNINTMSNGSKKFYQYMQEGMPSNFKKYFKEEFDKKGNLSKITILNEKKFINEVYNYGKKVIGVK